MIIFKYVKWKNFLSTGNVETQIDLNRSSSTLIVGPNGAGKSTFLDAISFALFGRPYRKINKPQLLNTINKKDCVVETEFSIGLVTYKIVRGLKPNIFEIYKDGTLLNQDAQSRDYQAYLEKNILKTTQASFCQIVTVGSASYTPFLELTSAKRREFIEELLDLQIFTRMNLILKDEVTTNAENIKDNERDIKFNEGLIKVQSNYLQTMREKTETFLNEKKERLKNAEELIDTYHNNMQETARKISELESHISDTDEVNKKMQSLMKMKVQLESKHHNIQSSLGFFKEHSDCPTCKQNIQEEFKTKAINEREKQLIELNDGLVKLNVRISDNRFRMETIEGVAKKIAELQFSYFASDTLKNHQIKYADELRIELDKAQIETFDEEANDITSLNDKNVDLIERQKELLLERDTLQVAQTILKDGGIKATIIRQYIPIINNLINKYLATLEFFINFELNEEFEETIKSRFRDDFSYASFSEGEKMRINLALLFAWRAVAKMRNSLDTNVLVMDEIFDGSMDGSGIEEFIKVLQSFGPNTNSFIITHKTDQFYDKFNHIISFKKVKNFSQIMEK